VASPPTSVAAPTGEGRSSSASQHRQYQAGDQLTGLFHRNGIVFGPSINELVERIYTTGFCGLYQDASQDVLTHFFFFFSIFASR
jgi:hypothetical protein